MEMEHSAGLVTKFTAAMSQVPTVSSTGGELLRFARPFAMIVAQVMTA